MIIYTKPFGCPPCNQVKKHINKMGYNVEIKNVQTQEDIDKLLAKGIRTVPVLELQNGDIISGAETIMTFLDEIYGDV